ncbi:hypothetical protein Glo7428_4851 [Gloeocapsa sp. PCC 7428]|uniref:hypothetical protein n=1 Tax=Gloeocapsa sp. PCC 7428 TaxID=1173026 RepID=UPI0002A5D80D|nr:hypothetical protein [Gloeocapsa sp. PCC 7428]AFZ33279.1 hypothetical protein Glo7428_4851 [Gloeocapsa sp. PCC 7428]
MLKLIPIGAALATIITAQPEILPSAANTAQKNTSTTAALVVKPEPIIASTLPNTIAQTRYRTPQQTDDSGRVGTLVVLGAIGATAAVAIAGSTKNKLPAGTTTKQGSFDKASPKLQKRLMTLLHNDQAAANRLIANIKLNHPHQSTNWAIEKAIYDLERDRGGR